MADTKISGLAALTQLASDDELVVVDKSDASMAASGTTKRIRHDKLAIPGLLAASGRYYGPVMASAEQFTCLDTCRYFPIRIGRSGTLDRIAVAWGNVAGDATMTVRLGIHADVDGLPDSKLVEATFPAGQSAWTWVECVISVPVTPGRYWLAVGQNGTGTPGQMAGDNWGGDPECYIRNSGSWHSRILLKSSGVTGALPDPASWDWQEQGGPMMAVRMAA